MKLVLCLFLCLAVLPACNTVPKTGNPDKPYYQCTFPGLPVWPGVRLFGAWAARTPHTITPADETDEEFDTRLAREQAVWQRDRDRFQIKIGDWCTWAAIAAFVVGAYIHFSSVDPTTKSRATSIMTGAGFAYAFGALMKFEARAGSWPEVIVAVISAIAISVVLYKRRNKKFSIFKKKTGTKENLNNDQ